MQKIEGRKFYISLGYVDEYVLTELENVLPTPKIIKSLIVEEEDNNVYVMTDNKNKLYLLPLMLVKDISKEENSYVFKYILDSSKVKWYSSNITDDLQFNIIGLFEAVQDGNNESINHLVYYSTNYKIINDGRFTELDIKLKEELLNEE